MIGRNPADPVMQRELPEHLWDGAASVTPTEIDSWSTSSRLHFTVYQDIAVLVAVLVAYPLVSLGGLASRLMARRRQRRIATLRLLGASTAQVVRLTTTELVTFAGIGAILGAGVHRLTLPWTSRVPIKGQQWFISDVQPSLLLTLGVVATAVVVLTLAASTELMRAVRDPIGTYRSTRRDTARLRWWSVVFIGAAVALFWLRSDPS